jgi:hypothetical protein
MKEETSRRKNASKTAREDESHREWPWDFGRESRCFLRRAIANSRPNAPPASSDSSGNPGTPLLVPIETGELPALCTSALVIKGIGLTSEELQRLPCKAILWDH